jgi:hypothetical protein
MSAPTYSLSQLTLDSMSPATSPRARGASPGASSQYTDDSSSEFDSDFEDSGLEDNDENIVRSPTKFVYCLDQLSEKSKAVVRDAFTGPPKIALQRCRLIDNTYAFQMTELVTRSIRIRDTDQGVTRCSCGEDGLCEHLVWLLDQILKQTLYNGRQDDKPLTMTDKGCAQEMGDPFRSIADCHLDILAAGLHCQLVDPDAGSEDEVDPQRALEARELLSAVHVVSPDDFRPDIFAKPCSGKKVLKRHDLDRTVFRMLLDNHHFFHYFLSQCTKTDPIHDPFRKLLQRVEDVLRDLDAYSLDPCSDSSSSPPSSVSADDGAFTEGPRDVPWAAKHILGSVGLIRSAIYKRDKPLKPDEAISAARTLVRILEAVVDRNHDAHVGPTRAGRNLYWRLMGDRDIDFVVAELNLLPEATSQFLNNLEAVLDKMGVHGAPPTYVGKFRSLLSRLRTSNTGSSLKRQSQDQDPGSDRWSKRMK